MKDDADDGLLSRHLQTMQIIAVALLAGVLAFVAIGVFVKSTQNVGQVAERAQESQIVTLLALGTMVVCVPMSIFIPILLTNASLAQLAAGKRDVPTGTNADTPVPTTSKLLRIWQISMLIGLAMLEGSAFLACLAYLMEGLPIALGIAAVTVLLMLVKFPTKANVRSWLDRHYPCGSHD